MKGRVVGMAGSSGVGVDGYEKRIRNLEFRIERSLMVLVMCTSTVL